MPGIVQDSSAWNLPPLLVRNEIAARFDDLTRALREHPQMRPGSTVAHVWDFAMRTEYLLSELDNIAAGRPVRLPEQIPDYCAPRNGAPGDPAKVREHMEDVFTRSITLKMMIDDENSAMMLASMGLMPVAFGDAIKAKVNAVMAAFGPIREF